MKLKPDYGIDAPMVIRNLLTVGIIIPVVFYFIKSNLCTSCGLFNLSSILVTLMTLSFLVPAILMILSSKIGKLKQRDKLLNLIKWKGDEQVLDVGCGRGLMLIGAAKKLTTGKATGIDIWQTYDLSGNSEAALINNAKAENVLDKIVIKTADARKLPFADNSFDIVFSNLVIHNIYQKTDREQALSEMIRVIKPGGKIIIQDFQHINQYTGYFKRMGMRDVKVSNKQYLVFPFVRFIIALK